jgi:hypothetical protein
MSLDIAILGEDGAPHRQISIGVEEHWRLIEAVAGSTSLLARIQDYYQDVHYSYEELASLAQETAQVRRRLEHDHGLFRFLGDFQELIAAAREERKGLSVLAE